MPLFDEDDRQNLKDAVAFYEEAKGFDLGRVADTVEDLCRLEKVLDHVSSIRHSGAYERREPKDIEREAPLHPTGFKETYDLFKQRDLKVLVVVMNPRDYADLRRWGRDLIEIETRALFLRLGLMCTLWGGLVLANRYYPEGEVMILGEVLDEDGRLQVSAGAIQVIKVIR